jgi:hypothetical protein
MVETNGVVVAAIEVRMIDRLEVMDDDEEAQERCRLGKK